MSQHKLMMPIFKDTRERDVRHGQKELHEYFLRDRVSRRMSVSFQAVWRTKRTMLIMYYYYVNSLAKSIRLLLIKNAAR